MMGKGEESPHTGPVPGAKLATEARSACYYMGRHHMIKRRFRGPIVRVGLRI
jgi:hypothetical protein